MTQRTVFHYLSTLALAATVAACGGSGDPTPTTQPQPPEPVVPDTSLVTTVPAPVYSTAAPYGQEKIDVFNQLNDDRARCGFGKLTQNGKLDQAAQAHADYLKANPSEWAHTETSGHIGFTGSTPHNRGVAAGYSPLTYSEMFGSSAWGEWFTSGAGPVPYGTTELSARNTLRRLYATVYHLSGLMNGNRDIGLGIARVDWSSRSFGKILNVNTAVASGAASQLINQDALATFPCDGTTDVNPFFLSELPDPFPGVYLDGNPYGQPVYLMSATGTTLSLTSSSITKVGGASVPTRLLNASITYLEDNTDYEVYLAGTNTGMVTYENPTGHFTRSFTFRTGTFTTN